MKDEERMNEAVRELVNKYVSNDVIEDVIEAMEGTDMEDNTVTINNVTVNNVEEIKEDMDMNKTVENAKKSVEETVKGFAGNVKVEIDAKTKEVKTNLDDKLNELKDRFIPTLSFIGDVLGLPKCKEELCKIIFNYTENGTTVNSYNKMAIECRNCINRYIDVLKAVDPDGKAKEIMALYELIGEDGEKKVTQSIFTSFAKGVVWLVKKAARKVNKILGTDETSNIFGAVGAKIAGVISKIFNVAVAIVGFGLNIGKYALSYAVAAALKVGTFVLSVFKSIFDKIKDFITPDYEDDFEDDFDYFDIFTDEEDDYEN